MHAYVFTIEYSLKGPVTDGFIDASALVGQSPESFDQACKVAEMLDPGSAAHMTALLVGLKTISLRARFTALGRAFILKSEQALTRDDMDALLQRMAQTNSMDQLQEF